MVLENKLNIANQVELATISILEIVQTEGEREVKREIEYYNLDAFNKNQKIMSDFDKTIKQLEKKGEAT